MPSFSSPFFSIDFPLPCYFNLTKILKVILNKFTNLIGENNLRFCVGGNVSRECYLILPREIFKPNYALF